MTRGGGCNEGMDGRQERIYLSEKVGLTFLEILAPRTQSPEAKIRFFAATAREFLPFLLSLPLTVSEGTAKGPSQNILNARSSISDDLLPNANSYSTFRAPSCLAYETGG